MGCLFRLFFLLLVLAVIGLPAAAVLLGLDREPQIVRQQPVTAAEMRQAALIGARIATAPASAGGSKVTLSESEVDLLVRSWASRAPRATARAAVSRFGLGVGVTVETPLPENPLGRYVNIRATVAPSQEELLVDRLAIGGIEVPQILIRPVLRLALDLTAGPGQGEMLFDTVRSVAVAGSSVTVGLSPAALGGFAAGALPSTGNARIDELIRSASPADRQRVMDEIRNRLGDDPAMRQKALEALQQRFGGSLPAGSEQIIRELQQRYGGQLPSDPDVAIQDIRRRLADDPAARDRAIRELKQRYNAAPPAR